MGGKKLYWEEVRGIQNRNAELIKSRHLLKNLADKILGNNIINYIRYLKTKKAMKKTLAIKRKKTQLQKANKIAIIFVGTKKYVEFFPRFYFSLKKFFLPNTKKDFFVLTDKIDYAPLQNKKNVFIIPIKHLGTSLATLYRFKYINNISQKLKKYSHIIYIDVDIFANRLIEEKEFFCHDKPLFGVIHPGFVHKIGQFEFNKKSSAAVDKNDDLSVYRQCCLWGGKSKEVLKMCRELDKNIDKDLKNKIIAVWLDESHLNKYFAKNSKKVYDYNPSYAYPENKPIPKPFKKKMTHGKGHCVRIDQNN